MSAAGRSRLQRLLDGWSANLVQLVLGVTQQLALVPIILHYCSSDVLAAWLALYAASNLVLVADFGLQPRAINRFLALKSSADGNGRSAQFFFSLRRVYLVLTAVLVAVTVAGSFVLRPSDVLGFRSIGDFDAAFVIVTVGMLLILPSNVASALYRSHGLYGRVVWMQSAAMLVSQLAQVAAIVFTGRLTMIALTFVVPLVLAAAYLLLVDARALFPFLAKPRTQARWSWRWSAGQFRRAFPFAIAGSTEIALQSLPVLMVSAIVADRVAVAQWGLTRIVSGLVRVLCVQASLPVAAELGHDHAVGATEALRRLYARGSVLVTLLASAVVSGLLAFWPDFFALWTRGAIPYDPLLTWTLLVGAALVAPAMLALNYGYYSDRGTLLARTKGLQLACFMVLSLLLTPWLGPLGMALALVATDLLVQFGLLASTVIAETLQRPLRHVLFLAALIVVVTVAGWALGAAIRAALPLEGFARFIVECIIWLGIAGLAASPLASRRLRARLTEFIPG